MPFSMLLVEPGLVTWQDDHGGVRNMLGYEVQYIGGVRSCR